MKKPSIKAEEYFCEAYDFYKEASEKGIINPPLAIKYFKKAMKLNHPDSYTYMILCMDNEFEDDDMLNLDEKSALLGSEEGMVNLSSGYLDSRTKFSNVKIAYHLFSFLKKNGCEGIEEKIEKAIEKYHQLGNGNISK